MNTPDTQQMSEAKAHIEMKYYRLFSVILNVWNNFKWMFYWYKVYGYCFLYMLDNY